MAKKRRTYLTVGMLEVMLAALNEVEAGEGFQGMDDLTKAQDWIVEELLARQIRKEVSQ